MYFVTDGTSAVESLRLIPFHPAYHYAKCVPVYCWLNPDVGLNFVTKLKILEYIKYMYMHRFI